MRIELASIHVNDPQEAMKFYTEVLGFQLKNHIPEINWITVVSPERPDGVQLLLEPSENPTAQRYMNELVEQGIPATGFAVDDLQAEYERLRGLDVEFTMEPTDMGQTHMAIFDDTCGNLIQIYQMKG